MPLADLRNRTFGLLTVRHYVGIRGAKAYWCCVCKCMPSCRDCNGDGCRIKVCGTKLITGKQVSCGCSRADSAVRRAAAMKVPVKVRQERAEKGGKCRASYPPNFSLTLDRAAELIGVDPPRVIELSRLGVIRTVYRKSARTMVSATDVTAYIEAQQRKPKACPRQE